MKKKLLSVAAVIWALVIVAVGSSAVTMLLTGNTGSADSRAITDSELETLERYSRLEEVRQTIIDGYYIEPDSDALVQGAIDGMLASLDDPFSFYYTAQDMKDQMESSTGKYVGVGMSVQINGDGFIKIVRVFENSPAFDAGILSGDLLVAIDGDKLDVQTSKDLSEAVTRIRGTADTEVTLTVRRAGEDSDYTVTRRSVDINYTSYEMIDDIGYLRIYEFEQTTAAGVESAIKSFKEQGAKGIVLDLRDDPGGLLDSVIDVADMLLPKGRVVYTEDRAGNVSSFYSSDDYCDLPLVVLINGQSASASEILAASLQDFDRGTLVGTTSFGKGIVQLMITFPDGAGMQYTESRYFTPSGRSIHGVGIEPDITVEMKEDYDASIYGVNLENDNQLAAAMDEIWKLIGSGEEAAN